MTQLSTRALIALRRPPARGSFRVVPATVVDTIRAQIRARTDEALTEQFGISYNTWRKLEAGAAIRASVAERLEARLRRAG